MLCAASEDTMPKNLTLEANIPVDAGADAGHVASCRPKA